MRLTEEWDPRLSSPLKEKYTYEIDTGGRGTNNLKTLTPPGQEPWQFKYYVNRPGQPLKSVSRATLQSSPATATTTIAYEVPISGENAPYNMSPSTVARWGQTDFPVDATAVFPPSQVPDIENFGFRSSFGSSGSEAGQMDGPRGATIGPEGNIWVADTENSRIVEFDPEGQYLFSFGSLGSADGQLDHPRGLAFDPEGNIWVADTGNNRIQKFTPEGVFLAKAGSLGSGAAQFEPQFNQPSGIAILENGSIWVTDTGNNRVERVSPAGNFVEVVTGLSGPTGIAPRGHILLVADTGNNRIAEIIPSFHTPTGSFGGQGSGNGQMSHPEGIGSDALGNYWVADTGNNRIEEFTSNGVFVDAFGSSGSGSGQLSAPAGLAAVDGNGNLYVADSGNDRIEEWNSTTPPIDDYTQAVVHYMDPDGYEVNTAAAAPPGVAGSAITTSETDAHGNVVRSLSAQNRLLALNASDPAARSHELDSHSTYSTDGTEMQESWGPLHQVRLESGETVEARPHTVVKYDEGAPALKEGEVAPHLPTKETSGAAIPGQEADADQVVTVNGYDWTLRKPTTTIVDPGSSALDSAHLSIGSSTRYDKATGLPVETNQPSELWVGFGGPGTTKTVYYSAEANSQFPECGGNKRYAGLVCRTGPGSQTSGTNRPQLLVKKIKAYNDLDEPTEIVESPGGGAETVRKSISTYDSAGRPRTQKIEGGGQSVPTVETQYSSTTGAPTKQLFLCTVGCTGFDSQATTTTYDALGRVKTYEDADGGKTYTTYDSYGRAYASRYESHREKETLLMGGGLIRYDEASGAPIELENEAGTFTASYDADGKMIAQGLPNGLTAETAYNVAGEPMHLTYAKEGNCGESCTWLDFSLQRSISGQIVSETGTLGTERYGYDKAGRLTSAEETPTGGSCTTRAYTYDLDSNRKSLTTRSPGLGGACASSGGTTKSYEYDAADRLVGPTYDSWGRITSLPASFAGGKELTTSYFSTDMVATQTQGGITNSFELDASLRQRTRQQAGGLEGTETFHYAGPSDAPAWTERGQTWTLNISGLGGELGAIMETDAEGHQETILQLTNLHGDVVATAADDPEASALKETFSFDEFGNPISGSAGRFGWLGGKQRRTELPSGVIQMGKRSYVPTLGRFLTRDPVPGGSANAYDYAGQDPVNAFDLGGEKLCRHLSELSNVEVCANTARGLKKRVDHVVRVANRIEQKYHSWRHAHPHARTPTEKDGWTPCKVTGVGLSTVGAILSTIGVGLDATGIGAPAGVPITLVGGTSDLAGVGADEAHDAGWC